MQRASDRGRNRARLAADIERFTVSVFDDPHDTGVAREPAGRFGGKARPLVELTAPRGPMLQRLGIDVHDDLLTLTALERGRAVGHEALRNDPKCIGPPCGDLRAGQRRYS